MEEEKIQEEEREIIATGRGIPSLLDYCFRRYTKENSILEIEDIDVNKLDTKWILYKK